MKLICYALTAIFGCALAYGEASQTESHIEKKDTDKSKVAMQVVEAMTLKQYGAGEFQKLMNARADAMVEKMHLEPKIADGLRYLLRDAVKDITPEHLNAILAKPYEDNFTIEELIAIRDFYESDAGKELLRNNERVRKEQEAAKQRMSEELAVKMNEKVKAYLESRKQKD